MGEIPRTFLNNVRRMTDRQLAARFGWSERRIRNWRMEAGVDKRDRDHDWGRGALQERHRQFVRDHWGPGFGPTRLAVEMQKRFGRSFTDKQISRFARKEGLPILRRAMPSKTPLAERPDVRWRCPRCASLQVGHYLRCRVCKPTT